MATRSKIALKARFGMRGKMQHTIRFILELDLLLAIRSSIEYLRQRLQLGARGREACDLYSSTLFLPSTRAGSPGHISNHVSYPDDRR